ncbi:MAG: ketopantoate reductase family protein [Methanothrix sp.]
MTDILIYGAGAIGSFLGYLLSQSAWKDGTDREVVENVALLGRAGHINAIKKQGLHVDLGEKRDVLFFRHCFSSLDELKSSYCHPRLVIVCVKTYSLPDLSLELKESGLLEERFKESLFILLMNGMGNREVFLHSGLDPACLREGITSLGVLLAGEGKVELKGRGKTVLQNGIGLEDRQFLEKRFSEKGFEIEFSKDFSRQQFLKLLVNAAINPITALTRRQNGIILHPALKGTVEAVVAEAVAVAEAEGLEISAKEALELVFSVAEKTAANTSSMLQDVLRGKETEIEAINGYLVREAKKHRIAVPVNEALYGMVKAVK